MLIVRKQQPYNGKRSLLRDHFLSASMGHTNNASPSPVKSEPTPAKQPNPVMKEAKTLAVIMTPRNQHPVSSTAIDPYQLSLHRTDLDSSGSLLRSIRPCQALNHLEQPGNRPRARSQHCLLLTSGPHSSTSFGSYESSAASER